jgi:hypothetical protein
MLGEREALRAPRQQAMQAMHLAARWLAVEPTNLKVADYRGFRSAQGESSLPSPLAISVLFAGLAARLRAPGYRDVR